MAQNSPLPILTSQNLPLPLAGEGLCILVPLKGELYAWQDGVGKVLSNDDLAGLAWKQSSQLVLFHDAKATLRCLNGKLDVARPVCLKTLQTLVDFDRGHDFVIPVANSLEEANNLALAAQDLLADLLTQIDAQKLNKVARLECLVLRAFASMEIHGLHIDLERWRQLIANAEESKLKEKAKALKLLQQPNSNDLFGVSTLNLDSSKEVKAALETVLSQTLSDTSAYTLSALSHPAPQALLAYRESAKLTQTYGDTFLQHVHPLTGRIHATFDPLGTSTGRSACHSPNLQNLPSDEAFKNCLRAPAGRALVYGDYAACELRILGAMCGEEAFLEAFAKDEDLHATVASRMFGVPVSKHENGHLRQKAKAINFGLIYGMGPKSLASTLKVGLQEASSLFDQYFATYPKVKLFLERSVESAQKLGFAQTILGRKLYFPKTQTEISRIAKNMPIQGSGADIIKLAMLRLHERLLAEFKDAYLVNMVHDSLVVECQASDIDAVAEATQQEMEQAERLLLPQVAPKVDILRGKLDLNAVGS